MHWCLILIRNLNFKVNTFPSYLNPLKLKQPTSRFLSKAALASLLCGLPFSVQSSEVIEMAQFEVVGRYLYSDQVNALESPTPIINVPQSLSIYTAEQIQLQGFRSIGDIINYTPGVNTSQGEGHRDAVVFRGVRSTADFFIDGFRDDVQYYRPFYNLEQIEILRGPNALVFGRGGAGGILNRVTKKPVVGDTFTGYQASVDSFGAFQVQLDSNHTASDHAAFRVNAFFENLDNHRDFYDGERIGFNPTARFELSANTTLDLSYEYMDHDRFIDRGIPTGTDGRPVTAFKDVVFGDPEDNINQLEAHLLRATVTQNFSQSLKGNFNVFYGDYDKLYQNLYASSYSQANSPDVVTLDGYLDTTQRENLIISANLIGEFTTGNIAHTVLTGMELIDTTSNQDRWNAYWDTTADDNEIFTIARPLNLVGGVGVNSSGVTSTNRYDVDLNDDTRVGIDVFSFYLQDEIEFSEQWKAVIGGRFDSFDIEVFNVKSNETRTRKDEEVSPRLGLIYKPQQNISLYTSFSETFLPRSGEQFANINGNNNVLDPNTYQNLEAGLKWDFNQALSLTTSIFEIEQSSPQVADNDPSTLDVIDSQTTGFEVQLQGMLTDRWFISAGYSYLDGEQVNRNGPTGLRPRELPEHMFSVWNNYQVNARLGLGLGLVHQGESFINNSNSAILPSYTRLDAAAFYDVNESLRIQVNVENLTDELYFPNSHSTHQASVGAPINARIAFIGRF